MGEFQSKALPAEDEAAKVQQDGVSLFKNVPRRRRTHRPVCKGICYLNVGELPLFGLNSGREKADTFLENQSEILDLGYQHGPKKKQKSMIENTAGQSIKYSAVGQRSSRRKKRKLASESSNDDVYLPCFRVRGGSRRLNSSNCRKLDSKTFQERMEHIWSTSPGERRKLFSYLDSLWFHLYSQKSSKGKVLNWAEKKKDVFSKRYVLVPIVMWSHWSLLILCNFGESHQSPCMLLLDSLQTANPKRLEPVIRRFVLDIYNFKPKPGSVKSSRKIPLLVPKVPQQRDGEECGSFVLYYVSLFLERAPEDFSLSEGYPYFMKEDWFTLDDFDYFCKKLEVEFQTKNTLSSEDSFLENLEVEFKTKNTLSSDEETTVSSQQCFIIN